MPVSIKMVSKEDLRRPGSKVAKEEFARIDALPPKQNEPWQRSAALSTSPS